MNVAHKNFSDKDSKPLTGCVQRGIFAPVLKDITFILSVISTYHTVWKVIFLFPNRQWEN
jgi:hypothetical protein